MKKLLLSVATLIGLSAAGAAVAQGVDFASVDVDGNGAISFEELQAVLPNITPEDFAVLDTDGDGALSPEEFSVLLEAPAEAPAPLDTPAEPPMDAPLPPVE